MDRKTKGTIRFAVILMIILFPLCIGAENFQVEGAMTSQVRYAMKQTVQTAEGIRELVMSFVLPQTFQSPTYLQEVKGYDLSFRPEPQEKKTTTDKRGNRILTARWTKIPPFIEVTQSIDVSTYTGLRTIETQAPFPLTALPQELLDFTKPTEQIQSNHPDIRLLARELTQGVTTEFDALQRIITWVVDHLHYTNPPEQFDALYSLKTGKGNCQNFSHLSAALLRSLGIPVRVVNGITLNQPFDVTYEKGTLTFKMGQGRHSWIEVWFPDQGWIPCDPQNTQLFVSNRFLRIEVGIDNNETKNDGLVRWRQLVNAKGKPTLQEEISAAFTLDTVKVKGERMAYGPKNILLTPEVKAPFTKIALAPPPTPPVIKEKEKLRFEIPVVWGNLAFPEEVDFAFPRTITVSNTEQFEMLRNFLVETAEYVTTNVTQYAQVTVLQKPLLLKKVGLALHNFGGEGWLWVDLFADREGKPGELIATSKMVNLEELPLKPGYRWQDFDFSEENLTLMPGSYWIALGFTGNPIVNWFYTYGKPVGPAYGTRYKSIFSEDWSGALNYEFNYRLVGFTTP